MPASYGEGTAMADALAHSTVMQWAVIAGLTAVGTYLRLANLGELGFRWDEDLSSLAVRAILEKGVPELPSGMVYLRSGLFLYAMAGSAALFGFSELALRLPAALCGIALIPAAFFFGRALFDVRVGLIVGALVSLSHWDIEIARYARMYAPFSLLYVLTILCIWRYRLVSTRRAGGLLCIVLALAAVSLHQLGYTLALAFFFPLAIRGPAAWRQARNWVFPALASGIVAAFFLYWRGVVEHYRQLPALGAAGSEAPPAGGFGGLSAELASALPELAVLQGLLERAPFLAVALLAAPVAAALVYAARRNEARLDRGLVVLIAACSAAQLFNIALLGVLALAFVKRVGLAAFRRADVQFALGVVAATFLVWLTLSVGLDLDGEAGIAASLRAAVRALLDYPHFFVFWGYPNEWPLLSIVAAIGGLWALDRAARREPEERSGGAAARRGATAFLLLALGVPLVANGLFEAPFELFRYNVPLNTFYFAFVALGLLHWREVLAAVRPAWPARQRFAAAGTALLVLLVIGFDANPLRAWLTVQRQYSNEGPLYRAFDISRYDDFKTTAAFVSEHAGPDDLIIAFDSREYFNYLGRLDYWVRTDRYAGQSYEKNGTYRDLYIDTPLIMSLAELEQILATPRRTKWLLASTSALEQATTAVSEDIRQFLSERRRQIAYVGRDGNKNVYRF